MPSAVVVILRLPPRPVMALTIARDSRPKFATAVEAWNAAKDRGYNLAFSHGIVSYDPVRHPSIEQLLAEGDALMYRSKLGRRAKAAGPEMATP